jgi:single-stranded DNA-binding protein
MIVSTVKEWKGADGEMKKQDMRHQVEIWDHLDRPGLASMVEQHVVCGTYVLVEGAIEYSDYTSKSRGTPMQSTKVLAKHILILAEPSSTGKTVEVRDLEMEMSGPYATAE